MNDKLIQYYENTRKYYGTYHNHKEVSAWAGLALYVFFAGLVNLIVLPERNKILTVILITLFVLAVLILVYRYISIQIKMKDLACAYSATAFLFLAQLISEEFDENKNKQYMSIEESADTKVISNHFLPKLFLEKVEVMKTRGRGFQDTSRSMIYGMMILVTVLLLFIKWNVALS